MDSPHRERRAHQEDRTRDRVATSRQTLTPGEMTEVNFVDALRGIADMTGHEVLPDEQALDAFNTQLFVDCFPDAAFRQRLGMAIGILARIFPFPRLCLPRQIEKDVSQAPFGMKLDDISAIIEEAASKIVLHSIDTSKDFDAMMSDFDQLDLRVELRSVLLRLQMEADALLRRVASEEQDPLAADGDTVPAPEDDIRIVAFEKAQRS